MNKMALKNRKTDPKKKATPPRPEDPFKSINREAERIFHDYLITREFVVERGFHKPNAYFILTIQQMK